jgi:hypothetical protein
MDDNEEKYIRDISVDIYDEYCCILKHISIKDIKMKDRWPMLVIEANVREFINSSEKMYEALNKISIGWVPYTFNICLNEYGEGEEYFIDIVADVLDIDIDDNGKCKHGDIAFTISFNDERIPDLSEYGEVGEFEDKDDISDIDRLLYGDSEDISDKPWL